jgi:hypothetical protein
MKIKYIKKYDWFGQLTIGKTYDGIEYANGTYDISNDEGKVHGYRLTKLV